MASGKSQEDQLGFVLRSVINRNAIGQDEYRAQLFIGSCLEENRLAGSN